MFIEEVLLVAGFLLDDATTVSAVNSAAEEARIQLDCLTRPGRHYENNTCFVCPDDDFRFFGVINLCLKGYPDPLATKVTYDAMYDICEYLISRDFKTYLYTPTSAAMVLPWVEMLRNVTQQGDGIWTGVTRKLCNNCVPCGTGTQSNPVWCLRTKTSTGADIFIPAGQNVPAWTGWGNNGPAISLGGVPNDCAGTSDLVTLEWQSARCDDCMRGVCAAVAQTDGRWTPWEAPTACIGTCGTGYSVRRRTCQMDPLSKAGSNCTGAGVRRDPCVLPTNCTTTIPPPQKPCKPTDLSVITSGKKWLPLFISLVGLLAAVGAVCATVVVTAVEPGGGSVKPNSQADAKSDSSGNSGNMSGDDISESSYRTKQSSMFSDDRTQSDTATGSVVSGSRYTSSSSGSRFTGTTNGTSSGSGSSDTTVKDFSGMMEKLMKKKAKEKKRTGGKKS